MAANTPMEPMTVPGSLIRGPPGRSDDRGLPKFANTAGTQVVNSNLRVTGCGSIYPESVDATIGSESKPIPGLFLATVGDNFFESGTITPAVTSATPGNLSIFYSVQSGCFQRYGNLVFVNMRIAFSTIQLNGATGDLRITGLPYAAAENALVSFGGQFLDTPVGNVMNQTAEVQSGETFAVIRLTIDAAASINFAITSIDDDNMYTLSGWYKREI